MRGEKVVLAFPSLLTQIFLEARVTKLPDINKYIEPKTTTDLGLIRDTMNPMTKKAKQRAVILAEIL